MGVDNYPSENEILNISFVMLLFCIADLTMLLCICFDPAIVG
mgnify:FL=1